MNPASPKRLVCTLGFLASLAMVADVPPSAGAEENQRPTLSFELPRGVKVDLPANATIRDEDLAEILENYARKLRATDMTTAALASRSSIPRTEEKITKLPEKTEHQQPAVVESGVVFDGYPTRRITVLPATLLWQPPLANPYEPRFYVKATDLSTPEFSSVNDFNIGGTLALVRNSPIEQPDDGWQIDLFAMVLSRFADRNYQAATDYRFGLPITFARGPWSAKIAYEHTSTHLGDEYMIITGARPQHGIREELTFGLAYRPIEALRLYGVLGYAFHVSTFTPDPGPERYSFGAEWSNPVCTGWRGQPFAAADLEFRGDEDMTPNFTAQLGWQWLAEHGRPGFRIALEYRDGRSPFGQFLDRHESWVGLGFFFDY